MIGLWQDEAIVKMETLLKGYEEIEAVVLKGSCANKGIIKDKWSDIDLVIIVSDNKIDSFFPNMDWILPLGEIFAVEQYTGDLTMTTRVCLNNFMRFDLIFILDSKLKNVQNWSYNPFGETYNIIFSNIAELNKFISKLPDNRVFSRTTKAELDVMANNFWFLGIMAIVKVMRGDYLIGSHLAFEMVQQCIVLQMILRDHEKGTNIHRMGGCETIEILEKISIISNSLSPAYILKIINESGFTFDRLSRMLIEGYEGRSHIFNNWVSEALENAQI